MIILPLMYADFGRENQCCGDALDTATFSPNHQLTIGVVFILCLSSYLYCSYRKKLAPPVVEVLLNALLLLGVALTVFVAIHAEEAWLVFGGAIPVILYGVLILAKNQQLFLAAAESEELTAGKWFGKSAYRLLKLHPFLKYPVLLVLCLPIIVILSTILLLFGQKPDSIVRAFTDTYKHGFSQWDYQCDNVDCGGHYLCSVAANGHPAIVKPLRKGFRSGGTVICNRQLLVSNAFEELIQHKCPRLHVTIRKQYDKVGKLVHRYYTVFDNKFIADIIYLVMKPLEWIFLLVLYSFDHKPENRIARQYLLPLDRERLEQHLEWNYKECDSIGQRQ